MAPPAKVTPTMLAKAREMRAKGDSLRVIEEATGVSKSRWATLLGDPASDPSSETKAPPAKPPPPSLPAVASAPPDRRSALLALLADALDADASLLAALPLDASELARRLADAELVDGDLDELAILGRVQGRLERGMALLKPDQVVAAKGLAGALTQIASTAARVRAGRPAITDPPEVIAARLIGEQRDAAIGKIFEHVAEAERAA